MGLRGAVGEAAYLLRQNPITLVGFGIIALVVLAALVGPMVAPFDPLGTDPEAILLPPGGSHLLGTGQFGEDIWSRVLWGARIDLAIAFGAVAVALVIGCVIGAFAGFWG